MSISCVSARSRRRLGFFAVLTLFGAAACSVNKGSIFAPSDATIALSLSNGFIVIGESAVLTIQVRQADGAAVEDGTEVRLRVTAGTLDQFKLRTAGGQASTTYRAGSQTGTAQITATSGSAVADLPVPIVSAPVERIVAEANPPVLPPKGGTSEIVATVTAEDGTPAAGAPVDFEAAEGTIAQARSISDAKGEARTTLQTSSSSVVRVSVEGAQTVEVSVKVSASLSLSITASPAGPTAGDEVTLTFSATASDGHTPSGALTVGFGDGAESTLSDFKGEAKVAHTYKKSGTYTVVGRLEEPDGSNVEGSLSLTVTAASAPTPPPPPPTPAPGPSNDKLDLNQVTWLHHDVSGWKVTSKITAVSIPDPPVCIEHTKAGKWPTITDGDGDVLEGNPWVFAKINNKWYAATYEWLRPGQTCKGSISASTIGPHTKKEPLNSWKPKSGELVGFMVSTPARLGPQGSARERSNVVLVRWP